MNESSLNSLQQPVNVISEPVQNQLYDRFPTLRDKRELIKHQLEINFPTKLTIVIGIVLILIGLAGIGLQIALIINMALNYKIGNGIWGGFFSILNGLIKLNMVRSRSYRSFIIFRNLTLVTTLVAAVGLTVLSSVNLRYYRGCPSPTKCSAQNMAMTIAMLVLGLVASISNILFVVFFNRLLFKNAPQIKLSISESCSEWRHVCS